MLTKTWQQNLSLPYLLCILFCIFLLLSRLVDRGLIFQKLFHTVSFYLCYLNSWINSFLYGFLNNDMRKGYIESLSCFKRYWAQKNRVAPSISGSIKPTYCTQTTLIRKKVCDMYLYVQYLSYHYSSLYNKFSSKLEASQVIRFVNYLPKGRWFFPLTPTFCTSKMTVAIWLKYFWKCYSFSPNQSINLILIDAFTTPKACCFIRKSVSQQCKN